MSSLNFGCASVREKSIAYENNDSSKQKLVIVQTLHIEYDFSLKKLMVVGWRSCLTQCRTVTEVKHGRARSGVGWVTAQVIDQ